MLDHSTLKKTIFSLEKELLIPENRLSRPLLNDLLDDDYIEFGSSGRSYLKGEVIEVLLNEKPNKIEIENFDIMELSDSVILATYISVKPDGEDSGKLKALRSSIWRMSNEKWRIVFHQGTPLKDK